MIRVYAVVNKQNHLPVLAFEAVLPCPDEPPAQLGLRLATEAWTWAFAECPRGWPFVRSIDEIPDLVRDLFTVVEVEFGFVSAGDDRRRLAPWTQ